MTSYEAGIKSALQLRTVPLPCNMAAYTLDYTDIQRAIGDFNAETNASGSCVFNAKARIRGLEIEASARLTKSLTLACNLGLTDGKYKKFDAFAPLDS